MVCWAYCSTINPRNQARKALSKRRPVGGGNSGHRLEQPALCFLFWLFVTERPEFNDEPLDDLLIEGLRVFGCKDSQTNPVVAPPTVQEAVLVNPADLFVRKEVDLEHLKGVAHPAPRIFERFDREFFRPGLRE